MKTTSAETHLEVWVTCPYCEDYQNRSGDLKEHFDSGELSARSCEAELVCENKECRETFEVTEINY